MSAATSLVESKLKHVAKVKSLIDLLDANRATDYSSWIEVGFCLRNEMERTGHCFLEQWIVFSRKCPSKFDLKGCKCHWNAIKPRIDVGLGIDALERWARNDDPEAFKRLALMSIKSCDGSHNRVARVVKELLGGRFVCVASSGKFWYRILPSYLWTEDPDGISIRHELSTTVADAFTMAAREVRASGTDDTASQLSWRSNVSNTDDILKKHLLKIASKLNDAGFKDGVMKELREYFYDKSFLDKLDSDPNLIAFSNGVQELKEHRFRKARAEDYVCMNTGYDYSDAPSPDADATVERYWAMMHPDLGQREYVLMTLARQLYGDSGKELFHIHSGHHATVSNGKTRKFLILENCLGSYVSKFGIEVLTAKQRIEPGKPMPEFAAWRGVRFLYCTEPNADETINSGIMKDLTGGELLQFRLLFSNNMIKFRPMFKLHLLCNDKPKIDGTDSGNKRRVVVLSYVSRFVDPSEADPDNHCYPRDDALIQAFKDDLSLRQAFVRQLFRLYDHGFMFKMPEAVLASSKEYIEDNDMVHKFVEDYIMKSLGGCLVLSEAKEVFKSSPYWNNKPSTLKADLVKALKTPCLAQKWVEGKNKKNVFEGFKIVNTNNFFEDGLD